MSNHLKKLTLEAFELAIRKGQGRALYHALNSGIEETSDILLQACIKNQVYDPQCETSRANWLFQMFHQTSYLSSFSALIIEALTKAEDFWDIQQLCELVAILANQGSEPAKQALNSVVMKHIGEQDTGSAEWVNLEGAEGLIELARIYGQRYLSNLNFSPNYYLLRDFEDDPRLDAFTQALVHSAKQDNSIQAYVEFLKQQNAFPPFEKEAKKDPTEILVIQRERMRQKLSVRTILEDARAKRLTIPGRYAMFGKIAATAHDLERIFRELINEPDDEVCLRLLWVFSLAPMPRLHPRLWKWVDSSNDDLRRAALRALSHVQDESIHQFIQAKLKAGWILGADTSVVGLLKHNFDPNDGALLLQALESVSPSWYELHHLGSDILAIAEQQNHPSLGKVLEWVYEETPCSNCRASAVRGLQKLEMLNEKLLLECLFDADEELRGLAQQQLVESFDYTETQLNESLHGTLNRSTANLKGS